ncbi:MAG: hypothetical protein J2P20_13615, partial [Pseudonocardia sp.]|nr:hypothetical protein [Pseudonocardia sp.]
PVAAGLGGADYTNAAAFDAGFRRSMLIGAALLVAGAALSALLVRPAREAASPEGPAAPEGGAEPLRLPECAHCGVTGPQLHPGPAERA